MAFTEGHLDIFYRPVVNPMDRQVMIYRAVPVLNGDDQTLTGAKQVLTHNGKPYDPAATMDTAERNADVIIKIASDLAAAHGNGYAVFAMFPISAKALATKEAATIIVKTLKDLPPVCSKAAIAHVFDMPEKLTLDDLDTILVPLLISMDKFVVEPPDGLKDFTDIGTCNAQGVVLDMDPEEGSSIDLTKFWSRAAPRRLGIFAQNVQDGSVMDMMERYEGRGVDGPLFGDLLPEIGPRTTREQL